MRGWGASGAELGRGRAPRAVRSGGWGRGCWAREPSRRGPPFSHLAVFRALPRLPLPLRVCPCLFAPFSASSLGTDASFLLHRGLGGPELRPWEGDPRFPEHSGLAGFRGLALGVGLEALEGRCLPGEGPWDRDPCAPVNSERVGACWHRPPPEMRIKRPLQVEKPGPGLCRRGCKMLQTPEFPGASVGPGDCCTGEGRAIFAFKAPF